MKSLFLLCLTVTCAILLSCASAGQINRISVGMSKNDVLNHLGDPASVSATEGVEYLNYRFSETGDDAFYGRTTPYYVRIINGRVDAYGRMGDFDSTKTPTVRVEHDQKVDHTITRKSSSSSQADGSSLIRQLKGLKQMRDAGDITDQEYNQFKKKLSEDAN